MARAIEAVPLCYSLDVDGYQPSISVSGRADYSNISDVVSVLKRIADERDCCVSLDLENVTSIDTAALEGIVGSAGLYRERHRRLRLENASSIVLSILDRLHLCELFCEERECGGRCSSKECETVLESWAVDVFTLPCDISFCHEARTRVDKLAESVDFSGNARADIALALGEAVSNAVKYGCSDTDDSRFTISCVATSKRFCVSVSDNGPGFNPNELPSLEDALFMEHGRGVHCMNAVMDEVTFHFDKGTTVRLVKYSH